MGQNHFKNDEKEALWAQFLRFLFHSFRAPSRGVCQPLTAKSSLISYTQLKWCMFAVVVGGSKSGTLFPMFHANVALACLVLEIET